ncbi:Hypothetical predicted protein [Pelobates cultripes]|uniref:Uncharacterized protein n=1 Tax=Pelobates cultripes TaxID=61616 RepID=A0AAD1TF47_PELCU|nr:Hypothetical predicted protein [Pelobates cultripes]
MRTERTIGTRGKENSRTEVSKLTATAEMKGRTADRSRAPATTAEETKTSGETAGQARRTAREAKGGRKHVSC